MCTESKKDIKKQISSLEAIESLILKYKRRIEILNRKKCKLFMFSKKMIYIFKILYFKDELSLYLLRNILYRILDKSLKDTIIRKLIKLEILKAPKGTFSDFIILFNDLKKEL